MHLRPLHTQIIKPAAKHNEREYVYHIHMCTLYTIDCVALVKTTIIIIIINTYMYVAL